MVIFKLWSSYHHDLKQRNFHQMLRSVDYGKTPISYKQRIKACWQYMAEIGGNELFAIYIIPTCASIMECGYYTVPTLWDITTTGLMMHSSWHCTTLPIPYEILSNIDHAALHKFTQVGKSIEDMAHKIRLHILISHNCMIVLMG